MKKISFIYASKAIIIFGLIPLIAKGYDHIGYSALIKAAAAGFLGFYFSLANSLVFLYKKKGSCLTWDGFNRPGSSC